MTLPADDDHWQQHAYCRGEPLETFYPPDNEKGNARHFREQRAKQICLACPVLDACRAYAVGAREPYGVWRATTPRDREKLIGAAAGRVPQAQNRPQV